MPSPLVADLARQIADRQAVVLVGAGVSIGATGAAVASWTGLLRDGVDHYAAIGSPPPGWADRVRAQIDSGDLVELLLAAENVASRLGAPDRGEFVRWLGQTVGTLRATDTDVIRALADLGVPIATTNYDGLIEEVTGLPAVTWRQGARVERVLRGDERGVLHLHGHWQDPESVILGIRSYEAIRGAEHAQAVQRALAMLRTMVFVGFGAGLDDPNFGQLLTWVSRVLGGSPYRHYRLCLTGEVAQLTGGADPAELTPLPYGDRHADLAPFLRGLAAAPAAKEPEPAPATRPARLPPRPRCLGRDPQITELTDAILADPAPPVPVLGPPGIGKTTLAVAALHRPAVAARFGARRWFVRCSAADLFAEIVTAVGLTRDGDPRTRVLDALAAAPALLVLDNAETPWEADWQGTEAALAELADVPGLTLVVTLRGRQRPLGVSWRDPIEVTPLRAAESRDLFLAVAGQRFRADPNLDRLVSAQDGLPLTIELLARLAESEPNLAILWRSWQDRRHALINSDGPDFRPSPEVTFEVSINGPRMTDAARRLLGLLSVLPDGIAHDDLDVLLPDEGPTAASTLRRVGLARDDDDRLRALQPVRDHVDATHPVSTEDIGRLVLHWCELTVRLGERVNRTGGAEAVAVLTAELGNIHAMLDRGLDGVDPALATDAVIALSRFLATTGPGSDRIVHKALERARRTGWPAREAALLVELADLAHTRRDQADVTELYRRAQELYQATGDLRGQGRCEQRLGNEALIHDDYATADDHYQRARSLFERAGDRLGQADAVKALGDLALGRDEYTRATEYYEQARPIYQELGELMGQANCTRRLGNIARKRGDHAEAARCFGRALPLFERIGDVLGQANCVKGLGDVALAAGDHDEAGTRYQHAKKLYEQIGDVLGQAICVKFLGDAALAQGDRTTAITFYQEALPLYDLIRQPYSTGTTYRRLARISTGDERTRYLEAAREAFNGIGRDDMIRQLDEEFGTSVSGQG